MPSQANQGKTSYSLDTSLQYLKGVGPERFRMLQKLGLETMDDLLHLFPRRYEDRSQAVPISGLTEGTPLLTGGRVIEKRLIRTRRGPEIFRLTIDDGTGRCTGTWFNCSYLDKTFQPGQTVHLYGKGERQKGGFQMVHPDHEIPERSDGRRIHTGRIVPVYPSTQDLYQRIIRSWQYELLVRYHQDITDPIPPSIRRERGLANKLFSMKNIHFPASVDDLQKAYERLVFEEFFVIQLTLAIQKRAKMAAHPSGQAPVRIDPAARDEFAGLLPFELTDGQKKAIGDVLADLMKPEPMHRLLQGEVGSGKTTVAAFALYATARAGHQGAIMAPTEILAQQHYLSLSRLLSPAGISVVLLTQGQSPKDKDEVLRGLAAGEYPVAVGTHALIQDRVKFRDLRLAVVDEQHKFGVSQRKFLQDKSRRPNLLVMTATPIPRTLAMTLYGDLDISTMEGVPKGRGRVETVWVGENQREGIYAFMEKELRRGRQAYIVHSLIASGSGPSTHSTSSGQAGSGQGKAGNLRDATRALKMVQERFAGLPAGLLHGKMSSDEKRDVMKKFKADKLRILVATTVIEVGIDVPNATILIVENADRFGLSQLHQLRGRIGRGKDDSTCVLFSDTDNPDSAERLRAFTNLSSGFDIAEEDLKLRGPGDFFGSRQHGIPDLRIGDLIRDISLLESARRHAFRLVDEDPLLASLEHADLKREVVKRFRKVCLSG